MGTATNPRVSLRRIMRLFRPYRWSLSFVLVLVAASSLVSLVNPFLIRSALDTGLLHRVLGGLSTREYARCAEAVPEAFGLSASTVSRRFKRATARKLRELTERRLEGYDLVALLLDGKTFAEDEMVAAVGVTITGEKVLLGFVQTATENRKVCAGFLRELVERGLRSEVRALVLALRSLPR